MSRQSYLCEDCGVESHVDYDEDAVIYGNIEAIRADHRKWSPECAGDLAKIKLLPASETSAH